MRLINAADLTFKTEAELIALIGEIAESLRGMDASRREYDALVSSHQVVRRALVARRMRGPKF